MMKKPARRRSMSRGAKILVPMIRPKVMVMTRQFRIMAAKLAMTAKKIVMMRPMAIVKCMVSPIQTVEKVTVVRRHPPITNLAQVKQTETGATERRKMKRWKMMRTLVVARVTPWEAAK